MATKSIRNIKLSDTLTISECKDGYWIYDKTRGMNISMRAKTCYNLLPKKNVQK